MEKNSFKSCVFEVAPSIVALPIAFLGMFSAGCEGEHDLLTTGFNCESSFHAKHETCGITTTTTTTTTTTVASSATASFLSPNQEEVSEDSSEEVLASF